MEQRINTYDTSRSLGDYNPCFVKSIYDHIPDYDKPRFLDIMRRKLRAMAAEQDKDPETVVAKGTSLAYRAAAVYADTDMKVRHLLYSYTHSGTCDSDFDGHFMLSAMMKALTERGFDIEDLEKHVKE